MKKVMKDIFSKLMLNILKNFMKLIIIYHFYLFHEKLVSNLHDKTECYSHKKLDFTNKIKIKL